MNIKKCIAFLKVVELGSITQAAAVLGHTQSGVTQLIRSLEEDLGVVLLHRSRGGIRLTEAGEKLYPYISDIVACSERLTEAAAAINGEQDQTIRIGTFTSVAVNWLPDIIRDYQKVAPEARFELIDCGYNNIEEELSKKQMDFGFVPLPLSLHCKSIPLYKDRLLAVLPQDHPFAHKAACPLSLFKTDPVIRLLPDIDRDAGSVFRTNRISPNTKYTVEDDYAMLAMVENHLGICIMPELMLRGDHHRIATLELDPPAYRTIGIAFPSYETVRDHAVAFARFAAAWIDSHNKSASIVPSNETI